MFLDYFIKYTIYAEYLFRWVWINKDANYLHTGGNIVNRAQNTGNKQSYAQS